MTADPATETASETPTIALWAVDLSTPLRSLDDWLALVDGRLAEAAAAGADLLVLPEYASEHWLAYAPADLAPTDELAFMAAEGEKAADRLAALAARHGVALLAGTGPARAPEGADQDFVNRAALYFPEGGVAHQDKLCLTPAERDPAGWHLATGERVRIVRWRGLTLAIVICLDIELPALAVRLAAEAPDLDLLLVPSITEKRSGYERVFACARARAVELQAAVCVVGAIGTARPHLEPPNHSGAAVFLPCEAQFAHHGRLVEIPGRDGDAGDGAGPLLIAHDVPVGAVRRSRNGSAEVWPGAWTADGLRVVGD